ncbi:YhcN/YlaJ family sporulation lipoprotein [Rummeliibacillus pycnus]|uniref:YhcN/YlaJ family sporulation lipoprotein n=1 Tax=Rummeliibacillus pycnus TaxID=101070 RepID=UPI000C9BC9A5|nr:YhcN/YlaJ family sporulation lipoprotein [Rummeliibacillus pycnus]
MKKGLLLLVILLLVGCSNGKNAYFTTNNNNKLQTEQQDVEKIVKNDPHIKRVVALFTKDAALIGIEVKPFSKWNKKKYEKKWQKEIEKALPDQKVLVSTDLKIIWEVEKLTKNNVDDEKLKKEITKLKDHSKEET